MPASTGKTGRNVYMTIETVELINVKSISVEGRDSEEIDFTHLRSEGGYRELQQGFKDPGTVNMTLQFDPTNVTHNTSTNGIEGLLNSGNEIDWTIDFTDAGWAMIWHGVGFIKSNSVSISVDGAIEATVSLRISGATTWAAS
jgi:hypothetical protein